ncbi:hypothetical protein GCM10010937_16150 [Gluconobacter japonicus]|uniref:Uncharacterized protein n=1 Tax=Gluconobacter japonicus TaxID=376620 RepID=A0ABQ5WIX2_GLUJA|nr:hypothetical protein GCM10010937_16150 [Gluconobacter japonicus]
MRAAQYDHGMLPVRQENDGGRVAVSPHAQGLDRMELPVCDGKDRDCSAFPVSNEYPFLVR